MATEIETKNISFRYVSEGETDPPPVLNGVSVKIKPGEFVAVLGHNGSGKSTLAKHLNGILLPTEGEVLVGGIDTREEEQLLTIRQHVGMVFQNPDNQIVATVVEEDVAFAPENLGVPPVEIRDRVQKALEAVGMTAYREHAPHQLSGGQKQRVAIAGVLAMRPDVIVLDEPTAMLDPQGRAEVIATVKKLCREEGLTAVLITHYMNEAAEADRCIVMNDGKVVLDGTPREVFHEVETLEGMGLEVPQATKLAHELAREGISLGDVISVEECVAALREQLER